ncbi:MAG: hypothetical protein CM1200mP3_05280 [Chloroflexota bacterium]|nr:MAG: hypothetical protein CM1200mP3_05280 [Chloroflexota bacterium]
MAICDFHSHVRLIIWHTLYLNYSENLNQRTRKVPNDLLCGFYSKNKGFTIQMNSLNKEIYYACWYQLKARNDDDYRVFAQLGVNHICGYPDGDPSQWTVDHLSQYREHVESFGLKLDFIPLPLNSMKFQWRKIRTLCWEKAPNGIEKLN